MRFDYVIGNPPYNKDIYIPFVELGHRISAIGCIFVTPAKWQTKNDELNRYFRTNILTHISDIVYYPNTEDIFNIYSTAGVAYYLVTKEVHYDKRLKCICMTNDKINGEYTGDIRYIGTTCNLYIWRTILDKVKPFSNGIKRVLMSYSKDFVDDGSWIVKVNLPLSWGGLLTRGCTYVLEPTEVTENSIIEKTVSNVILFRGSKEECNSFKSYIDTKFIRFLIFNLISAKSLNKDIFSMLPEPTDYTHLYSDAELYMKYNLTQEEIDIIESVIKERK